MCIGAGATSPQWIALLAKVEREIAALSPGPLVFRIELPLEPVEVGRGAASVRVRLAPTMNEYAGMRGWMRAKARAELDRRILVAKFSWPRWSCAPTKTVKVVPTRLVGGRVIKGGIRSTTTSAARRLVRVTRYSSRRVDEPSTDAIGGKIPIDRLHIADIIGGDSARWIEREVLWHAADPGHGKVVIEVFALASSRA
jgi:hypothetical protein